MCPPLLTFVRESRFRSSMASMALSITAVALTFKPFSLSGVRTPYRVPSKRVVLEASSSSGPDKQLSNPNIISYAEISDEFKPLVNVALSKLDTYRALSGKPKYETVDGMIDSYVQEASAAGLGWTREEAESEVVRYLQRRALADEGGIDGDGQDKAAFALLALLIGLVSSLLAQKAGLIEAPPFQLPPM